MRTPFKKQYSDRNDKFVFLLAFFGGTGAIIAIRTLGSSVHGISIFDGIAILVAIGVIALYAFYISATTNRSSMSLDRGSDNVYYLGLLFTLISLAYSLIKLSLILHAPVLNVDGTEVRTSGLVVNLLPDFGLALFSTIAGILGRIILQQMRNDPKDVETQAREELGDAIRHLRENIGYVIANLNSLSEQTRLSLTELNQMMARTLERSGNQTSEAVRNVTSEINALSSKVREQTTEITNFTNNTTSQFQEIIDNIHNQFAGLSRISGIVKDAERANDVLSKIGSHADALENTSKTIEEHGKRIKSAAQGVEEASDEYVEELSKTSEVLRSKIR